MSIDGPPPPGSPGSPPPPSPRDLTGSTLAGRYRIVQRLGVGAMGEVYLGEHLRMGRRDAIKVLRSGMARDPEAMARFTRGARNVARIRHPNVCQVYDFGEAEDGVLFLAMEYVDGGSLGDLLKTHGPLPPHRAARLLHQAAEALHAAHEQGIIHRDLKPDNLMLTRATEGDGQVKVVDFDIARGPADEEGAGVTRHGFVVGTPEYMSPEQLTGDPLDRRSDVYSLALVLVRMLTGKLPFSGTTAQEVMLQRLTGEPAALSALAPPGVSFPPALETAVQRALARLPDVRTPSSRELAREVAAAVTAGGGAPAPDPVPPQARGGPTSSPPGSSGADRSPAHVPPTEVAPVRAGTRGARKGWVVPLGAGVGALALGTVVWALASGGSGDAPVTTLPPEPTPLAQGAAAEEGTEDPRETATPQAGTSPSQTTTGGGGAPSPSPAAQPQGTAEPVPPPPGATAGTPTAAPSGIALPGGAPEARSILMRQFTLLDDTGGTPSAAVRRAARDTTQAVWQMAGISTADSALAAHVLGLSLISLGDSIRGVDWLDTAVDLDPVEAFVRVRDVHRRPPR